MRRRSIFTPLISIIFLMASFCMAQLITVDDDGPADYTTIQAAIDAAEPNDIVLVADGVYMGDGNRDINFTGKAITVKSENGPTNCIIDASDEVTSHRAFIFESAEDSTSVIEGFTITGGYITTTGPSLPGGGGIACYTSTPSIRNCIFYENSTEGIGGAIYYGNGCYDWPVLQVENSTFYGNVASYGGASSISGTQFNEINFTNCIFKDNVATEEAFTNNFHEEVIAKCGPVVTSVDFTILDAEWFTGQNNLVADPLFADPNNGDFHLKSEYGRWDPDTETWVIDAVTSPGIDFGDPNDDYSNEVLTNGGRINAGAYGNTPEASLSYWYFGPDYDEWVAVGMPESWCTPYQCHGDADGNTEIIAKQSRRVGYYDINILLAGFNRPYAGESWIAADFDHHAGIIAKQSCRVDYADINILLAWFNKADVPTDCQTANPVVP